MQQLTTLLVSAVPLGILGFTLIARLIREEKHTLSLEELRVAAAEAKERTTLQQEIDAVSIGRGTARAKRRIQAGKEMFNELISSAQNEGLEGETAPVDQEESLRQNSENEPLSKILLANPFKGVCR